MGGAPGEGVTLDGSVGAVGEEFPPQATYPSASRMRNARLRSFFISDSFRLFPARRDVLPSRENEQAGCHVRVRGFI
jgi:hypothetical protein